MAAKERKERKEGRSYDGRKKTTDRASPSDSGRLSLCSVRSLRPTSFFSFSRCSTRFALALPPLPATLCPKEHRPRMARTKSNSNASDWFRQNEDVRDTLLPKLLNGEVNAISADNFQNSK